MLLMVNMLVVEVLFVGIVQTIKDICQKRNIRKNEIEQEFFKKRARLK
jgi:hypothetical protein